jgi:2-haloacid dehalogenase
MGLDRRELLHLAGCGLAVGALASASAVSAAMPKGIRAIAFDAFAVFDPRPVFALTEQLFPGHGEALASAWRARQFEYQWLRALSGRYADFWHATQDALIFSAQMLKLELTDAKRDELMATYLALDAWPDVPPALHALRRADMRLALLSNATPRMLDAGIAKAGLANVFERALTTDPIRTFKPDPRAYQLAVDAFRLRPEEILFVAFAGWDAAGAKWFGYPTYWVNRSGLPAEELDVVPDGVGHDLSDLVTFVTA